MQNSFKGIGKYLKISDIHMIIDIKGRQQIYIYIYIFNLCQYYLTYIS